MEKFGPKDPSIPVQLQLTHDAWEQVPEHNQPEQSARRQLRWGRIAKLALLAASYPPLSFLADNASWLYGRRSTLAPVIAGCEAPDVPPHIWLPTEEQATKLDDIAARTAQAGSGATRFRPTSRPVNSADRGQDILLVPWNFDHTIDEFTMPSTGLRLQVRTNRSNSGIQVDRDALEYAFNEPMERWYIYTDKSARNFFYCAKQRLIDGREQAGTTITVTLPSDPNYCNNGIYAVAFGDNSERSSTCITSGFNFPNFDFGLLDPFVEPHLIHVSGRNTMPEQASAEATQLFSHESTHEIMRLMETKPLLRPDERLAKQAEKQLAAARQEPLVPIFIFPAGLRG